MDKEAWLRNGISNNLIDRRGVVPPRESTIEEWLGETIQRGFPNMYQLSGLAAALTPRINLTGGPGPWTGEKLPEISKDWVLKRDENRLQARGPDNNYPSPGMYIDANGVIHKVKDTRNIEDRLGKDAAGPSAAAPDKRDRARQPTQVDTAFRFSSQQPKSSGKMAEWWQSPAYDARAAAGQVQTPGLVDWGGLGQRLYDDLQAPYWRRQDQIQGAAVADPMQSRYVAQPRFVAQMGQQDPLQQYAESGYVAKPRFASIPRAPATSAPWTSDNMQMAAIRNAEQPKFRVATGPDSNRLTPNASGYSEIGPTGGTKYPFNYPPQNPAVQAIEAAAPAGPMFPLKMPSATGTPYKGNYTASMRFASPNAGKGSDIIDLTASNPSERGAQGIADSQGAPVRVGQKVYYPGGKAPVGAPQARNAPATQQRSGGLGGLLGSIFGGGNLGGGRAALESGWTAARSSIGNSPDQGKAMTVNPGTSSGSVLSGMGFSDGALVPAATIRNLESRDYFK